MLQYHNGRSVRRCENESGIAPSSSVSSCSLTSSQARHGTRAVPYEGVSRLTGRDQDSSADGNRVALVTGAASGIGRAVAHTFVAEGCTRLALADVNREGLDVVAKELNDLSSDVETCLITCDVAQEEQVQSMIDETVRAFGALHYAVNNAGISSKPRVRTHELEVESYDRVHSVNQRGVWLCERAELRQMLKQEPEIRGR